MFWPRCWRKCGIPVFEEAEFVTFLRAGYGSKKKRGKEHEVPVHSKAKEAVQDCRAGVWHALIRVHGKRYHRPKNIRIAPTATAMLNAELFWIIPNF
jgi:hypothetical protein